MVSTFCIIKERKNIYFYKNGTYRRDAIKFVHLVNVIDISNFWKKGKNFERKRQKLTDIPVLQVILLGPIGTGAGVLFPFPTETSAVVPKTPKCCCTIDSTSLLFHPLLQRLLIAQKFQICLCYHWHLWGALEPDWDPPPVPLSSQPLYVQKSWQPCPWSTRLEPPT